MAFGEATKKATRDYRSYSETPWGLWDTMYSRRSHRKYLPLELSRDFVQSLGDVVSLSSRVRGAGPEAIIPVTQRDTVEEVRKRSYKGLPNKINLWLARHPLSGFLVIAVPRDDLKRERPAELPGASVALEDCVLWLAEREMGTCWLGGVNQKEIMDVMGLGKDMAVPVVVALGKPKLKIGGANFDNLLYQTISRRRKPMSAIASVETMGNPYTVDEIEKVPFSASAVQEVNGILGLMSKGAGKSGDAPLELVIDACLEAARIAPSASNAQPWHFVVVEKNVAELAAHCGDSGGWRVGIVAAGKAGGWASTFFEKPFWMIDLPIALSHISLMATSMDCESALRMDGIDEGAINRLVGLPAGMRTAGVLGIK